MTSDTSSGSREARHLQIFTFLWGWFTLFHQFNGTLWAANALEILMTFAAVIAIARPRDLRSLGFLVLAQLATFWHEMPNVTNHTVLAWIIDLTLIVGWIYQLWKGGGAPVDAGRLFRTVAPVIRLEVVALYFWATFHKVNVDFLHAETSAAVEHFANMSLMFEKLGLPGLPMWDWVQVCTVYGTLIIEGGIPLLCLFAATRVWGVWLGLLFHYMLGFEDYYDFSAMAYAVLFLFAPANFPDLLAAWWQRSGAATWWTRFREAPIFRVVPAPLLLFAGVLLFASVFDLLSGRASDRTGKVLFLLYGLPLMAAWLANHTGEPGEQPAGALRPPVWAFALLPLLVFVNGLAPHLGLKTRSAFAMFSNLRTEGEQTNHLVLPESLQVFDYQRDMVRVESASHEPLRSLAAARTWQPYFNLQREVSALVERGATGVRVTYVRPHEFAAGQGVPAPDAGRQYEAIFGVSQELVRIDVEAAERVAELAEGHGYLSDKLLLFGSVNPERRQINRH